MAVEAFFEEDNNFKQPEEDINLVVLTTIEAPRQTLRGKIKQRIETISSKRPLTESDFIALLNGLQNEVSERDNPPLLHNEILQAVNQDKRREEVLGGPVYQRPTQHRFRLSKPHLPHFVKGSN